MSFIICTIFKDTIKGGEIFIAWKTKSQLIYLYKLKDERNVFIIRLLISKNLKLQ